MINLVISSSFKRAFKKTIKNKPDLKPKIEPKLRLLATAPYHPNLRTHKLKGKLSGAYACSVEYDCRIIFSPVTRLPCSLFPVPCCLEHIFL